MISVVDNINLQNVEAEPSSTNITLYKTHNSLSEVKPPSNQPYISFEFSTNLSDSSDKFKKVDFIKEIITDQLELTAILNDIRFLVQEKFSDENRYLSHTPIENSTIFYVYVAIPLKNKKKSKDLIEVFPYDIMHIRKKLNDKEIFSIKETLKRTNTVVHSRQWGRTVKKLPFKITTFSYTAKNSLEKEKK